MRLPASLLLSPRAKPGVVLSAFSGYISASSQYLILQLRELRLREAWSAENWPPKSSRTHALETVSGTVCRKRVFAGVIKSRISRQGQYPDDPRGPSM